MYQREMVLYTNGPSLRSWRIKGLLRRSGYHFEVLDASDYPEACTAIEKSTHNGVELPYVFIDHRPAGGFGAIKVLARTGDLAHLLYGEL